MATEPKSHACDHSDLFPETLLVERSGDRVYTNSLKIAEHFGKHHRDVLRAIRDVTERTQDTRRLRNFAQSSYINQQGKEQPMYLLTRSGFQFTAMGFTGPEADQWKWAFIDAFDAMEAELHALREREANTLYRIRPRWKPIVQNPDLSRRELIKLTGHKSPGSITACRKRMREMGLLDTEVNS